MTLRLIFLLFCFLLTGCRSYTQTQKLVVLILHNHSPYRLDELRVFSTDMERLNADQSSDRQAIIFNETEDDPILTFKIGDQSFLKYLPVVVKKEIRHIYIDSVDSEHNIVFIHSEWEPDK